MATSAERDRRATRQRARRMAGRTCGHCGSSAELMMSWGDRKAIPICRSCHTRLDAPAPHCSFHEVGPEVLTRTSLSSAIQTQTEMQDPGAPEDDDGSGGIVSKIWSWLTDC